MNRLLSWLKPGKKDRERAERQREASAVLVEHIAEDFDGGLRGLIRLIAAAMKLLSWLKSGKKDRERAERLKAAASADPDAIMDAVYILGAAAKSLKDQPEYHTLQSAAGYLYLQIRDARLWRDGLL